MTDLLTGYLPHASDDRDDPLYEDGAPGVAFGATGSEGDSGLWDLPNPVLQQVDGSCVPNVTAQQVRHIWWTEGNAYPEMPSRSWIFYWAKAYYGIEGANGCYPRGAYLAMQREGFPAEQHWEHTHANNFRPPSATAYKMAYGRSEEGVTELRRRGMPLDTLRFSRIDSDFGDSIRQVITARRTVAVDLPVDHAFATYKAQDGFWRYQGPEIGRHYVLLGAYNAQGCWALSSWGAKFGYRGGLWVPWNYLLDRSFSFDRIVIYNAPRFV